MYCEYVLTRSFLFGVLLILGGCSQWFPHSADPDSCAIRYLHELTLAQRAMYLSENRYGTLQVIEPRIAMVLSSSFIKNLHNSYKISLRITASGYSARAVPLQGSQARRSFFVDESCVLRQNWGNGPADEASEVLHRH
jgi:hypothetical protein